MSPTACASPTDTGLCPGQTIGHSDTGIITIVGSHGNVTTTIALDNNGYIESIEDPSGKLTEFGFSNKGKLESVTEHTSATETATTSFDYDTEGRLIARSDPAGGVETAPYFGSETLERTDQAHGFTVTHTSGVAGSDHDAQRSYKVEFSATGEQVRTTYLVFPSPTPARIEEITSIGIDGTRTIFSANGMEQTSKDVGDPRFGMQAPITSTTIESPLGLTATIGQTQAVSMTDPTQPLSMTHQVQTVVVNGRTITREFTKSGSTSTIIDTSPENRTTTTTLNSAGQVTAQQVGNLTSTGYTYYASGADTGKLRYIDQGARRTEITYDLAGNVDTVTDPAGRTVGFDYDAAGRVTYQYLPGSRTIGFTYDTRGNLFTIAPPDRTEHSFTYLPSGQTQYYWPPQVSPALTERRTKYSYNFSGQLSRITRPDGATIFQDFDLETGELNAQVPSVGEEIDYHYDSETGDLDMIGTAGGQILEYTYDGMLPKSETWSVSGMGTGVTGSVSRTFDNSFRVISQSVNSGNTINFCYDNDDLLKKAGSLNGCTITGAAIDIHRIATTGLIDYTTLGNTTEDYKNFNGVGSSTGYNGFGEVTGCEVTLSGSPATTLYGVNYSRDDLGRVYSKTETIVDQYGTPTTTIYDYDYDTAGRLKEVSETVGMTTTVVGHYDYDANGNRVPDAGDDMATTFNRGGDWTDAQYDAQDRLISYTQGFGPSLSTTDFTYSDNGELLTKTVDSTDTTSYEYDLFGNLRSVTLPTSPTATVIEYLVDGRNRRVGRVVNGTFDKGWLYDGQLTPVAEIGSGGSVVSRFVYGTKGNVPDYMVKTSTTYRIISDHLGSVRLVVNASTGAVAQRIDYDEFGNVLNDTSPGFQPFGFAGGLYDLQTGFVRFGARDYDPSIGRWSAKDPIGFDGADSNLYGYAAVDPMNTVDPSGLLPDLSNTLSGLRLQAALAVTIFGRTAAGIFKRIRVDGPSSGLAFGNGRVCQLRLGNQVIFRLDYHPYPGTSGQSRLHGHLGGFEGCHIPLDPRDLLQ